MNKKKILLIAGGAIVVVGVAIGVIVMATKGNDKSPSNEPTTNVETKNDDKKKTKAAGDFWINTAEIPSQTKELSVKILDDVAGVPVDLAKLENGDYTFNFTTFDGDTLAPGDYSVKTLAEIVGVKFYNEIKEIKVNNSNGDTLFIVKLSSKPSEDSNTTYQDSIKNNWWSIYLNEEKMFGKEFESLSKYRNEDRIQEIFTTLGKPTHIYVDENYSFVIPEGETVGSLSYDIVYEYDGFVLVNTVNETYNKPGDYRMINSYGLTYYTKEMYDNYYTDFSLNTKKDVVNELI